MGLFSFVRNAGGSLGSKFYDLLHDDEDINKPQEISPDRMDALRKAGVEVVLNEDLGEAASHILVAVQGDAVTLKGRVDNQTIAEKATLCAGNHQGIATVDCQLIVEQLGTEPETAMYTVKAGDTLSKIAKKELGNSAKYKLIFEANQPMLKSPDKIFPGQVLRIPKSSHLA